MDVLRTVKITTGWGVPLLGPVHPVGTPVELFPVHLRQNHHYDVEAGGERFLQNRFVGEAALQSAVLVRGWWTDDSEQMAGP
jgi:hypothetical protein